MGAVFGYTLGPYLIVNLITFEKVVAWVAPFGLKLAQADMFWFPVSLGAAIGAICGVIGGVFSDARKVRRDQDLRQTVKSLGARLSASSDTELSDKLQRFFPGRFSPGVDNVVPVQMHGIRVTMGEATILSETGSGTDRETRAITQTVAYYESDNFRFPKFNIQPEGFMLNLLAKAIGIVDIDFPAHAEFSRAYQLTAEHAESARKLFNDPLLRDLGRRQGLFIASGSSSLVLHRQGKLCEPGELKGFISEAAGIFRLFEDAARQSGLTAETIRAAETDVKARVAEMPGLLGKMARETLVTRADVVAFIRQPAPRKIPANILGHFDDAGPQMILLFGIVFAAVGAGFTFGFGDGAPSGGGGSIVGKAMGFVLGPVFLGVGGCAAFFAGRARIRTRRILRTVLRNGRVGAGRIEKIDDTGVSINNQAISLMTVRYQAEGQDIRASCKIRGHAVERAQKLAAESKPASILYSPADPQRIMFIDSLLSVGPQYEP